MLPLLAVVATNPMQWTDGIGNLKIPIEAEI
jgi:hypothetical protein